MKKYLLVIYALIALLTTSINCPAQSKKDTENWILYYMKKYFSDDFAMAKSGKLNFSAGNDEGYYNYQYYFSGNNLYVQRQFRDIKKPDNYLLDQTFKIDLSKIIKVEKTVFIDTAHYENPTFFIHDNSYETVTFVFQDLQFPVEVHDNINQQTFHYKEYNIIDTKDKDIILSGIIDRLIHAFENLVKLDGGELLKEVY